MADDLKTAVLKSLGPDAETRLLDAFLSGEVLNVAGMKVRVVSRLHTSGEALPVYEFSLRL